MSAWMNDAAPNHNGNNGFPHMNDPNAAGAMMDPSAFMANQAQFNPNQFANQQQMAAMQNGPMRHASPTGAYQARTSSSRTSRTRITFINQTRSFHPSDPDRAKTASRAPPGRTLGCSRRRVPKRLSSKTFLASRLAFPWRRNKLRDSFRTSSRTAPRTRVPRPSWETKCDRAMCLSE